MARRKNQMFVNSVKWYILILLVSIPSVYAQDGNQISTAVIALSIVGMLTCTIMLLTYKDALAESQKRIIFGVIVVIAIASTGYLVGNTVYLTSTSWSKGLVHWHADFEIWICGEKIVLPDPTGLANRIGTEEVHHHGDYRIHLEGIMNEREDATLGNFFDAINAPFSNEKIINMDNGDYCPDGKKGSVKMFVNGRLYEGDYRDYVIAPYSQVPPGDFIKIVFE